LTEEPEPRTKEELVKHLKELDKPLTVDDVLDILGSTVKHDDVNKTINLLIMLLNYTEEDQINLGYLAESSTGKSYIPLELSWYFPKEDVIKLGYTSPQTFYYESGTLIPDPSDTRDVEEDKKRKIRVVDLHQKILVFLDQPHDQLLQRLRSLLSHDEKSIVSKFVNKREKSGNRTETVIIEGFPTVIFCSAKFRMEEQEKTRLLLLSPEVEQEKLRETITLKIEKESDRAGFHKRMMEDPKRNLLATRIWRIKREGIGYINIPEELREQILQQFLEDHKFLIARHQRDISRLLAIIKGHALLNLMHRSRLQDAIIVNHEDVEAGFSLYYQISEANELGLPPEIYEVFTKLKPHLEERESGITRKEFQSFYFRQYFKVIGRERATDILKALDTVGLIVEQPDPLDRRIMRYVLPECGTTRDDDDPHSEATHIFSGGPHSSNTLFSSEKEVNL